MCSITRKTPLIRAVVPTATLPDTCQTRFLASASPSRVAINRTGSYLDASYDLQDPNVSRSAAEDDTAGEIDTGSPLVEAGYECLAFEMSIVEFGKVRVHSSRSIIERSLHVRDRGSHFGRRGGCVGGGKDVLAGHQRAGSMGLTPMSPVTDVTPVVVMPVLVKMAKSPAVPRRWQDSPRKRR